MLVNGPPRIRQTRPRIELLIRQSCFEHSGHTPNEPNVGENAFAGELVENEEEGSLPFKEAQSEISQDEENNAETYKED